ncbi:site-specific integrase [Marinobacter mangrovi]|uniref:site-specific integrase n=1 Tax=Marinobacter mangrovi TaxID=2803918 RepID=UPI001931367F|nr:site-specific integrase [Marinobacter mangrovi]
MSMTEALDQSQSGLLSRVRRAIQTHKLNLRTEQTYLHWITRYMMFHDLRDPAELGESEQQLFLGYLQERMRVSQARLNQARQALAFFYEEVVGQNAVSAAAS